MTISGPSIANLPDLAPRTLGEPQAPAQNQFSTLLQDVDRSLKQADASAAQFAAGRTDITNAVISAEDATVNFDYLMALRRQALAAYQQIMSLTY